MGDSQGECEGIFPEDLRLGVPIRRGFGAQFFAQDYAASVFEATLLRNGH